MNLLDNMFSKSQIATFSSIVRVGNAACNELLQSESHLFTHAYLTDLRGRLRTKLVQMQCEIESHSENFPFFFTQRHFSHNHCVPELRTKNAIVHIARSSSPDILPYPAGYKVKLSNNNTIANRQLIFDSDNAPPIGIEPFYGMLVFGGKRELFVTIQFPAPGYTGIIDSVNVPLIISDGLFEAGERFERKKALLKEKFLAHKTEEALS